MRAIIIAIAVWTGCSALGICADLQGTIVDHQGATQPKAHVLLRSLHTELEQSKETGIDGRFSFPNLPSGQYELRVSCRCFKTEKKILTLDANSKLVTNFTLRLVDKRCVGID